MAMCLRTPDGLSPQQPSRATETRRRTLCGGRAHETGLLEAPQSLRRSLLVKLLACELLGSSETRLESDSIPKVLNASLVAHSQSPTSMPLDLDQNPSRGQ